MAEFFKNPDHADPNRRHQRVNETRDEKRDLHRKKSLVSRRSLRALRALKIQTETARLHGSAFVSSASLVLTPMTPEAGLQISLLKIELVNVIDVNTVGGPKSRSEADPQAGEM